MSSVCSLLICRQNLCGGVLGRMWLCGIIYLDLQPGWITAAGRHTAQLHLLTALLLLLLRSSWPGCSSGGYMSQVITGVTCHVSRSWCVCWPAGAGAGAGAGTLVDTWQLAASRCWARPRDLHHHHRWRLEGGILQIGIQCASVLQYWHRAYSQCSPVAAFSLL